MGLRRNLSSLSVVALDCHHHTHSLLIRHNPKDLLPCLPPRRPAEPNDSQQRAMGNFLDTPITTKDTESGLGNGLEFGFAGMQGWRLEMEDSYVAELNPSGLPPSCSFFAVFDGHGGRMAAELASKEVIEQLANSMMTDVFPDGKAEDADPNKIGKAMRDAFMNLDRKISDVFEKNPNSSGCTALAALLTPTHIIVANTGDSRCVMAKAGHTVAMSFDHKPTNVRERERDATRRNKTHTHSWG